MYSTPVTLPGLPKKFLLEYVSIYVRYVESTGFFEKELKKDDIKSQDSNANPDAPDPRDMIDLDEAGVYASQTNRKYGKSVA